MKTSIIITCYNLGEYVGEALDSALKSTHDDFEVILVDDGSTEAETQAVVNSLEERHRQNPKVTFIRQPNAGLSEARNNGIKASSGECILPLDADNRIHPDYLSRAIAILREKPEVGVVYSWAQRFGQMEAVWEFPEFDEKKILLENGLEACSAFRRKVWEDTGGYDGINFSEGYEDWDFWLGALEHGWTFHLIPDVLFDYRIRPGSMVSACNEPPVRKKLVTNLIEKHKELYAGCWPDLLLHRELSTLNYEKIVEGYHQRFVESLADFQHFAGEWNERCERLEIQNHKQQAQLHQLRHIIAILHYAERLLNRLGLGK